ncbi:MAG: oligosaccharide flippase family protein [Deltaproteobacteria bacterium]|nr:oligosaccharide flippase family protein [Deltaproteobacteria bacterium]
MSGSFKKNIISNAGAVATSSFTQLLFTVALARYLGLEDFARYVSAVALIAVMEISSDFGTRIWAIRMFALSSHPRPIMRAALHSKLFYSAICAGIVFIMPITGLNFMEKTLSILIAVTQPFTNPFQWYLQGKERMDIDAAVLLVWRVSIPLLLIGLLVMGIGLDGMLLAWFAMNSLMILLESRLRIFTPLFETDGANETKQKGFEVIKMVFPIGASMFLMAIYQRLGVFTLDHIGSHADVAYFGAAFMLVISSTPLTFSIVSASFPMIARSLEEGNLAEYSRISNRMLSLINLFIAAISIIGVFASPFIITMVYGSAYNHSIPVMIALFPGLYISSVNHSLKFILNALHLNWADTGTVVLSMAVFFIIILSVKALPLPIAAALAWVGGEVAAFSLKWFALKRMGKLHCLRLVRVVVIFILISLVAGFYTFYAGM